MRSTFTAFQNAIRRTCCLEWFDLELCGDYCHSQRHHLIGTVSLYECTRWFAETFGTDPVNDRIRSVRFTLGGRAPPEIVRVLCTVATLRADRGAQTHIELASVYSLPTELNADLIRLSRLMCCSLIIHAKYPLLSPDEPTQSPSHADPDTDTTGVQMYTENTAVLPLRSFGCFPIADCF